MRRRRLADCGPRRLNRETSGRVGRVSDRICPSERKKAPSVMRVRVSSGRDVSKTSFVYVSGLEARGIVSSWQIELQFGQSIDR